MTHPLHHAFKAALAPLVDSNTQISEHTILSWTPVSREFVDTLKQNNDLFVVLLSALGTRGMKLSDQDKAMLGAVDGATYTHHDEDGKPVSTTMFCLSRIKLTWDSEGNFFLKHDYYMIGRPLSS